MQYESMLAGLLTPDVADEEAARTPGPLPEERADQLASATLMTSALEDVAEAIVVLDAFLRVVGWNRAATLITGFPAAAAVGSTCTFEGGVLTLDAGAPDLPGLAAEATVDRRFWKFRIKESDTLLQDVVATVIPLRHVDLGYFVHLIPRLRLTESGPEVAVPTSAAVGGGLEALTPRELEIVRLLAAGKTAKPIAAELSLSVPTVRTHIQHILRKLRVHSCLEAALCFLRSASALALLLALLAGEYGLAGGMSILA